MWTLLLSLFLLVSCSEDSKNPIIFNHSPGLLFVGTTVDYSSSALFQLDHDDNLQELLHGQSSDFALLPLEETFLAVNRTAADRNFRKVNIEGGTIGLGEQVSLDFLPAGEPSSVLRLDDDLLIFSSLSQGKLYIYDETHFSATPVEVDSSVADLPFRPVHLQRVDQRIFVVHQGLNENFQVNQTQMLFEIAWDKNELKFIDLNHETNGIQGIKLHGSVPTKLQNLSDGKWVMASWCSSYVGEKCKASYESLNFANNTSDELQDLGQYGLYQINASFVHENGDLYLGGEDTSRKFVKIPFAEDKLSDEVEVIHTYSDDQSYHGLFGAFSNGKDRLWIGDASTLTKGFFAIYDSSQKLHDLELPSVPSLSGSYVP